MMNALTVVLLYGNVAVAFQPPLLRRAGFQIPRPSWVKDAFLMTGMFSSYSLANSDFFIVGVRTQSGARQDRGQAISLPVDEHFVARHGVVFTQLFAAHQWDMHGVVAQRKAWKILARRIREHHNRLHPDRPVSRVRFGSIDWPQSPLGFRALRGGPSTRTRVWFMEPSAP